MTKIKELVFGEYDDIERALEYPKRVIKLNIKFPQDINKYALQFPDFTKLQVLKIHTDISHLPYLPEQIGSLITLKKLSILNVLFTDFPQWIFKLKKLEYVMVRGCEITDIPSGIASLKNLRTLRIENCELLGIPAELNQLTNLKKLSVQDTPLKHIESNNLPDNLKILNITATMIDENEKTRVKQALPKLTLIG